MSKFRCMFVMFVVLCVGSLCFGEEMIYLSGGTVVADTYYECWPVSAWYGESVTTLTIGTDDVGENEYIEVSGKITGISDPRGCWVEIGLVPKDIWDSWAGEGCWSAVFNKGLYVVHWFDDAWALGACLQEGWEVGYYTYTETGPSFWPLNRPTEHNPWEFSISMYPNVGSGGGEAYLWFDKGRIDSEEPFGYSNNDYSECYLIARIWSDDIEGAEFSFKHVQAQVLTMEE